MNKAAPKSPPPDPKGYNHFILAVAIGIIIGTLSPLLLEYFGVIDFVKNWP
jgi:hypothetical protein